MQNNLKRILLVFSDRNKCHPNPCRNGGICTGTNDVDGFECTCREGYKGKSCEGRGYRKLTLCIIYLCNFW